MATRQDIDILIRPATADDMAVLGRFGTALMSLHHQWDPARFLASGRTTRHAYEEWLTSQLVARDVTILVAEIGGSVVGYTYAGIEGYDYMSLRGPAGVIYDLFVDPDRRKQGVGRRLMNETIEVLAARGASQIVLLAAHANAAGQRLFNQSGFRATMVEMTLTIDGKDQA